MADLPHRSSETVLGSGVTFSEPKPARGLANVRDAYVDGAHVGWLFEDSQPTFPRARPTYRYISRQNSTIVHRLASMDAARQVVMAPPRRPVDRPLLDEGALARVTTKRCVVGGCDLARFEVGLCAFHFGRYEQGLPLGGPATNFRMKARLSVRQEEVLRSVERLANPTVAEVAKESGLAWHGVRVALLALEERGLVHRDTRHGSRTPTWSVSADA